MRDNPIVSSIDFDQDGVQHGFLKLPYSHDASAWGSIMIPITQAKNGDGPTVLLTGGNHGDEYEGPIALYALAGDIDPEDIRGRVMIVPAMNYPAFQAGRRTSPIDGNNLNRAFPGDPAGTVTQKIADYFQRTLLPMADIVCDIHSGGKSLDFVPFCASHLVADKDQQYRCAAARDAFNAPYALSLLEIDSVGMYDTAAEEMGKTFITTELGGGGTTTPETVAVARKGISNLLKHAGVVAGTPEIGPTLNLDMPDKRCFISSESIGLLETCVALGETVKEGQVMARVYTTERTGTPPRVYTSPLDGIFIARHFPGPIAMGDIVGIVAVVAP